MRRRPMILLTKNMKLRVTAAVSLSLIFGIGPLFGAQTEFAVPPSNINLSVTKSVYAAVGDWVGEFKLNGRNRLFKLHIKNTDPGAQPTFDILPYGPRDASLTRFEAAADRINFDLTESGAVLNFSGKIDGAKKITGEIRQSAHEEVGSFEMTRIFEASPKLLANYAGSYQTAAGNLIRINKDGGYYGADPTFLEYSSGRFGPLFPLSETSFFSGQTFSAALFPADVQISFVRDKQGAVTGLNYKQDYSPAAFARKLDFKEEEITFNTGDVKLSGTLTLPLDKAPHPAVVLVHGSGPESREFGFWRTFFASRGLAVLAYDKRGVGASTGDWRQADFRDLANDVLNGINALKNRPDIDAKRIGLWTISQGGWIVPMVASESKDVNFIIVHSGAMVTPYQQSLQAIISERQVLGTLEQEISETVEYSKVDQEFTRTGQGWEKLQQLYQTGKAKNALWAREPMAKDFWFRSWYRAVMDFDATPYWEKVNCPVLAFFGELDMTVRPEPSKDILAKALTKGGNKDFSIVVLPKASHGFLEVRTGVVRNDLPRVNKFAAGYFAAMSGWLEKRLVSDKRSKNK